MRRIYSEGSIGGYLPKTNKQTTNTDTHTHTHTNFHTKLLKDISEVL